MSSTLSRLSVAAATLAAVSFGSASAAAYPDTGGCSCHSNDLQNNTAWHSNHRAMVSDDCGTCHPSVGSTPVALASSQGGIGLDPIGCMGCHGRSQDTEAGAGLRQHHNGAGIGCDGPCHSDSDPSSYTTVGEDTLPPYYADPGTGHPNIPTGACADNLDNDGDQDYDGADSDCAAAGGSGGTGGSTSSGTGGATGGTGGSSSSSSGTGGATGGAGGSASGTGGAGGSTSGTGGTTSSGTTSSSGTPPADDEEGDCGCRVVAPSESPWAPSLLLLTLGLLLARRREG